jgi:hypothetical protein
MKRHYYIFHCDGDKFSLSTECKDLFTAWRMKISFRNVAGKLWIEKKVKE